MFNFKNVKPVSDVWSMAASFYSMLTGQFPRDFRKYPDPLKVIMDGEVIEIRVRDRSLPEALAKVIDRALSAVPKDRYRDAGQFREALVKALR